MATIILDAGHGGDDLGAVSQGRLEKNDNLRLALAVGNILQNSNINVLYTRTEDIYELPTQKAVRGNTSGADYFISIHRNSSPLPNQYSGTESLVYRLSACDTPAHTIPGHDHTGSDNTGSDDPGPGPCKTAASMARNINRQLELVGYANQGVHERPDLAVLHQTAMPAVLVEVGFINSDRDNILFDRRFEETAHAIADGILMSL